ncbi:hypothetical protein MIR68_004930 [Amoeboaphelidium protococcarum]|nr:hypothetical protein MIR68_004930 [Amoeboaphelidium protococcarum]
MGGVFLSLWLRDLLNRSRQILDYHQLVMVQQGIDKQEKLEPFGDLVQHKIGHLLTADAFSITLFPIQEAREQNNTKITRRFHPKYAFFCQRPYSYLQVVIPSGASTQLHELHSRQKDVELTTLRWPPKAQRDAAFGPKAGEQRNIFIRMHEQQAMNITEPRSAAYSSLQQTSTVLTTREGVVSVRSYRGGGAGQSDEFKVLYEQFILQFDLSLTSFPDFFIQRRQQAVQSIEAPLYYQNEKVGNESQLWIQSDDGCQFGDIWLRGGLQTLLFEREVPTATQERSPSILDFLPVIASMGALQQVVEGFFVVFAS